MLLPLRSQRFWLLQRLPVTECLDSIKPQVLSHKSWLTSTNQLRKASRSKLSRDNLLVSRLSYQPRHLKTRALVTKSPSMLLKSTKMDLPAPNLTVSETERVRPTTEPPARKAKLKNLRKPLNMRPTRAMERNQSSRAEEEDLVEATVSQGSKSMMMVLK